MPQAPQGIKLSASDITMLRYDNKVAPYDDWLADLKSAFDRDPSKSLLAVRTVSHHDHR